MEKPPQQETFIAAETNKAEEALEKETIETLEKIGEDLENIRKESGREKPKFSEKQARKIADKLIEKHPSYDEFITSLVYNTTPEWFQTATHLTLAHKEHPKIMKRFWELYHKNHRGSGLARSGVVAQAKTMQIFEKLGFSTRQATPEEDVTKKNPEKKTVIGVDFFANEIGVQVKSVGANYDGIEIYSKQNPGAIPYLLIKIGLLGGNPYTGKPDEKIVEEARKKIEKIDLSPERPPEYGPVDQKAVRTLKRTRKP